jgi:hypothetical protein
MVVAEHRALAGPAATMQVYVVIPDNDRPKRDDAK